jgi:hypothetical protein
LGVRPLKGGREVSKAVMDDLDTSRVEALAEPAREPAEVASSWGLDELESRERAERRAELRGLPLHGEEIDEIELRAARERCDHQRSITVALELREGRHDP